VQLCSHTREGTGTEPEPAPAQLGTMEYSFAREPPTLRGWADGWDASPLNATDRSLGVRLVYCGSTGFTVHSNIGICLALNQPIKKLVITNIKL
jgi:hypothetical protein